jgi:hypothetical protein
MNSITLRGLEADVRHVYHRAAQLGAWTIEAGHLTAVVRSQDAFRLGQAPLTFIVKRPNGTVWRWALTDVRTTGTELQGRVQEGGV